MLEVSVNGPQSDVMARINGLVEERRRLLGGPRNHSIVGSRTHERLRQVDSELEQLWLRRRAELNARKFAAGWLEEDFSAPDDESAVW
ncbi:DUF2630 family protein [Nitrolancea hollandica]|uniref:Uncharacterized protein n=1 Tax=Nitrolancea hollandica Lb TaxID=1129897 RepID=I4EHG1_9BACT|nr:DUF2630 family protein [Nitrolancea hollandica]CCF84123.1 conserved hypothetical protein [Nitrolancea hollandica Lb]